MLIDTHCHLDLLQPQESLLPLLDEAREAGIVQWVVPGISAQTWGVVAQLCKDLDGALPAYGIHPGYAAVSGPLQLEQLEAAARQAVAIGEIGLDVNCGNMPVQEFFFREQIRIARRAGLPLLIHCRGAVGRLITVLREERADQVGGIMHSFSGSVESAFDCIRLGFAISLSGTLTWEGALRPARLASKLPVEHLVVESDAPDLAPQAFRGQQNQPAWLALTVRKLSEIRGLSCQELVPLLTANSRRVLQLA